MSCLLLLLATLATHAYAGSGERVHIRLHMPEIVRQHTHVHKVYKLIDAPPPVHGVLPSKWPAAQPHISLLGYTTTASGTGPLMPDLTQLIATPTPNYGPALFDNKYLSESQPKKELQELEEKQEEAKAGKLFQQLFKPNIMDAMDTEEEPAQMENNELLNTNFLAALQREYMAKFGSKPPKTKRQKPKSFFRLAAKPLKPKSQTKSKTKTKFREPESEEYATNYLQDFEEQEEVEKETEELPHHTNYAEHLTPHSSSNPFYDHDDDNSDYDSASAFSTLNNNGLSFLPTPDEFLNHIHGPNSYTGNTYADLYDDHDDVDDDNDDYGPPPTGTTWKTVPSNGSNKLRHRQRRRPALDMITDGMGWATPSAIGSTSSRSPSTASGHSSSNNNSHHMRFPKLINRRKRKNRLKSKIYRI